MNTIVIHSGQRTFQVKIHENSEVSKKLMSEDIVKLQFDSPNPVRLNIGDFIEVFGRKYFLNTTPTTKKYSSKRYEYDCIFESYIYDLTKVAFLDIDETNVHFSTEFSVTGTLETFCQLIKKNLERVYGKTCWEVQNTYDSTSGKNTTKTLTFSNDNCLSALGIIVNQYGIEFDLSDDDPDVYQLYLYLRPVEGYSYPTPFKYGRGNGLYDLTKKVSSANNITTRIYVYGSSQNIGTNYRNFSPRLKIPATNTPGIVVTITSIVTTGWPHDFIYGYTSAAFVILQTLTDGVWTDYGEQISGLTYNSTGLQYTKPPIVEYRVKAWNQNGKYVYSDGTFEGFDNIKDSYIENLPAIQKYGLIERIVIFDDIFPEREGTVTSLGSTIFEFIDSGMFDLNAEVDGNSLYIIPGLDQTISFRTGNLAGYEFSISKYDTSTKKFTIKLLVDERGLKIPSQDSTAFRINTGDKYVILNINLPQLYVDDAEQRLLTAATDWLDTYSKEQSAYELNVDELFVDLNDISFQIGSNIIIQDDSLDILETRKVTELRRNLIRENLYTLVLSEAQYNKVTTTNAVSINGSGTKSETIISASAEVVTEQLIGVVNGVNTVFSTSIKYKPGSIAVFVNGLKEMFFDEISDTQIQLHTAPSNVGFADSIHAIFTRKII